MCCPKERVAAKATRCQWGRAEGCQLQLPTENPIEKVADERDWERRSDSDSENDLVIGDDFDNECSRFEF
jgi:hypothetical protein